MEAQEQPIYPEQVLAYLQAQEQFVYPEDVLGIDSDDEQWNLVEDAFLKFSKEQYAVENKAPQ